MVEGETSAAHGNGESQPHPPTAVRPTGPAESAPPRRNNRRTGRQRRNSNKPQQSKRRAGDDEEVSAAPTNNNAASSTGGKNPNRSKQQSNDVDDDEKKPPAVVAAAAAAKKSNNNKPDNNNNKDNSNAMKMDTTITTSTNQRNRNRGARKNNNNSNNNNNNRKNNGNQQNQNNNKNQDENEKKPYPPHWTLEECWKLYHASHNNNSNNPTTIHLIQGKLRVLPSSGGGNAMAFVACDRGSLTRDVRIETVHDRNRGLDGDVVFVELIREDNGDDDNNNNDKKQTVDEYELAQNLQSQLQISPPPETTIDRNAPQSDEIKAAPQPRYWQDDEMQMDLWNPRVPVQRQERLTTSKTSTSTTSTAAAAEPNHNGPEEQRRGRVVYVFPPSTAAWTASELAPSDTTTSAPATRRLVGSLTRLQSGTLLLTPNNRSLPQFKCPLPETQQLLQQLQQEQDENNSDTTNRNNLLERTFFQADYVYGSWLCSHKPWPPCRNVQRLGRVGDREDEIRALLTEFKVCHGDFPPPVLHQVQEAVQSGVSMSDNNVWQPTPQMCAGRRDYRHQRIFTIDPTTAKDLDDALHITELDDGNIIEVGVHIADVSYFVRPETAVDEEAQRRATTVYLVDRTVPMLPRPLCEVACSLNEGVDRLAFSCVWRMNANGTLLRRHKTRDNDTEDDDVEEEDVWYGRTVIRSCARLDYATAQNIIDGKVLAPLVDGGGDADENDITEELWPSSRRPTGGHTLQQVAADVRLMHRVAMARRRLRFANGALALDSVKLTFQLNELGEPLLAAPYPIRDSNRLVEEYMLLANYLVAQRLLTHGARDKACLRFHPPPLMESLDRVAAVVRAAIPNFELDTTSSQGLHQSLVQLGQICREDSTAPLDPLILKCITQMLTIPMQQAQYFCTGAVSDPELWRHFALNMPYYTHFTSPIRRYPDILVHRLLQATIDDTVDQDFPQTPAELQKVCEHCSEMQKASKEAQSRCDRVFLSLYLRNHPLSSELGIVLSVGMKAFTVYVPRLGADALLYLDEHRDRLTWAAAEESDGTRRILVQQKPRAGSQLDWDTLDVRVFTKVRVTIGSKDKPPIDIQLRLEGPWETTGRIAI